MKPKQKPFRVFLRRESTYELSLSVRFEVAEGYGALVLQRKDANKDPPPTLVYEEREISAKELRGGRFIHVLPGSSRRQSYALSRLSEEMMQVLPEEGWTELNALTEYGFRYLVTPENLAVPAANKPAAVQVTPAPATVAAAPPVRATPPAQVRAAVAARAAEAEPEETDEVPTTTTVMQPVLKPSPPSTAPSALQRAMAAIRAGRATPATITGNSEAMRNTPRPAPTAKVSTAGMTGRVAKPGAAPAPTPAVDADRLGHAEAVAKVKELAARLAEIEKKYADSLARESDLIEILARWQQREIGS